MTSLLELRTKIRAIYQKYSSIIDPIFKFIVGIIVFSQINSQIGYDERFTRLPIVLLISLVSAIAPWAVMVFLAMALALVHVYCVSKFLALFVLIVFVILYCFFLRFAPKMGFAVVAIPVLAPLNMHFAVPMYLGLTQNPVAILPSICGVVLYNMFDIIKIEAEKNVTLTVNDIVALYTELIDMLLANKAIIGVCIIFTLVIVVIYTIRKFSFDYSFEIALVAGMMVNVIGFLIVDLKYDMDMSIIALIFMSILCAAAVIVMFFMKRILDYTAVERVQFEDDDYYYYVKAIPKIDIPEKTHKVKHINKKQEDINTVSDDANDTIEE